MPRHRLLSIVGLYIVLALAALPLALGWIPPNQWYGFLRLPIVTHNLPLWYEVNAHGGRLFLAAMVLCALINLALARWGTQAVLRLILWINGAMILMSFWLVSLELVPLVPG